MSGFVHATRPLAARFFSLVFLVLLATGAQAASTAEPLLVRVRPPVAEPTRPLLSFPSRAGTSRPEGAPTAAAKARLEQYYTVLTGKLRAVPGVALVTEPGVPRVTYDIVMRLGANWEGVSIEAMYAGQPDGVGVLWNTSDAIGVLIRSPRLTALSDGEPPEDPHQEMDNFIQRLRLELFPPDRALLDELMARLRDETLDSRQRRIALFGLLSAERRPDASSRRMPAQVFRPDPALIEAATGVAMTTSDAELRRNIWDTLGGIGIPRIDPAVLVEPAERALETETDVTVLLTLVNVLSLNAGDPAVRAVLESVAHGDSESPRPEILRMAAQRVLDGGDAWNRYVVSKLGDPEVSNADRRLLVQYLYSIAGGALRLTDARYSMDAPTEQALLALVGQQGSADVAISAVTLLNFMGSAKAGDELMRILRDGTGDTTADGRVRRSLVSSLAYSLALHPERRPLFELVMEKDLDPVLRAAARQALDQTK